MYLLLANRFFSPPVKSSKWSIIFFCSTLQKFTHFRYFCRSFLSKSQLVLSYWWFLSFWHVLPPFSAKEKTKNWLFTSSFPQMPPVVWVFSSENPSVFLALSFFGCSVFLKRWKKSLIVNMDKFEAAHQILSINSGSQTS